MDETTKTKRNKRVKLPADLSEVERYAPNKDTGLNDEQVNLRIEQGLVNVDSSRRGKSVLGIILSNLFTFFNIVYMVIAVILCCYGLYKECSFLPVVLANTAIAIIQEIKSKLTLDKLNLITEPKVKVVRNGETAEIAVKELVLDDVSYLTAGEQVSADSIVLDGFAEVNEAILTGESDAVIKRAGDTLYAGSFIVSGNCTAQVTALGKYNYIASLTSRAKKYSKPRSQMLKALKNILVFVAIAVVPMTVCLYMVNEASLGGAPLGKFSFANLNVEAIKFTAGSIVSMIPAGPFLLTSIALAASFLRLAKNKTMAQELYCIEMLARVDTLCLDKTGTITDGTMQVVESIDLRQSGQTYTVREIMSSVNFALQSDNMTSRALKQYFGSPKKPTLQAVATIPFSSERKFSAVSFKGAGTYILGAPEFALKTPNERVNDLVAKYASQGLRVLLLAHSTTTIYDSNSLPQVRRPVAVIVIEDHIRADAQETIEWFVNNDVEIKVISGDNPQTVSNIAMRVGVKNADKYISLEGMSDEEVAKAASEYAVFGRVTPDQKAIIVRALREAKHTVAMTGDGVNDILALKEADCAISVASGSEAARNVSHIVLMDNNFLNLPNVVYEGRRVINNIKNSASLYIMKTLFITLLAIICFAMDRKYFFTTDNMLIFEMLVAAFPSFVISLQPNTNRVKGKFLQYILSRSIPSALTLIFCVMAVYLGIRFAPGGQLGELDVVYQNGTLYMNPEAQGIAVGSDALTNPLMMLAMTLGGMVTLFRILQPMNLLRSVTFLVAFGGALLVLCVPILGTFVYKGWMDVHFTFTQILFIICTVLVAFPISSALIKACDLMNSKD